MSMVLPCRKCVEELNLEMPDPLPRKDSKEEQKGILKLFNGSLQARLEPFVLVYKWLLQRLTMIKNKGKIKNNRYIKNVNWGFERNYKFRKGSQMKYKIGQKVKCIEGGSDYKDKTGVITSIDSSDSTYLASFPSNDSDWFGEDDLKLLSKDISDIGTYEIGDILVADDGYEYKVLEVFPNTVLLSSITGFDSAGGIYTTIEFVKEGYKFKGNESHKIEIDGKEIEISNESYNNLKESFNE